MVQETVNLKNVAGLDDTIGKDFLLKKVHTWNLAKSAIFAIIRIAYIARDVVRISPEVGKKSGAECLSECNVKLINQWLNRLITFSQFAICRFLRENDGFPVGMVFAYIVAWKRKMLLLTSHSKTIS
jgi:hypothetical protein